MDSSTKTVPGYQYVVGTGWWCDEESERATSPRVLLGDDFIRGRAFGELWLWSILQSCSPDRIVMVDSASPTRPTSRVLEHVEFLSLPTNEGHAVNCTGQFCGWTLSVLGGLEYAMEQDADYFVYVEQDALLKGNGIVEHCIAQMTTPFMFGSRGGTPQPLQQSFFILRRDGFKRFEERLRAIPQTDRVLSPETKFALAISKLPLWLPPLLSRPLTKYLRGFDFLPFGYGRERPIDFTQDYYYFQHGSREEVGAYCKNIGFALDLS